MISKEIKVKKPTDVISEEERQAMKKKAQQEQALKKLQEEIQKKKEEKKRQEEEKKARTQNEVKTYNGRQQGLTTKAGMQQAMRSEKDYRKWVEHETGKDYNTLLKDDLNETLRRVKNKKLKIDQMQQIEADKQAGGRLNELAAQQQKRDAAQQQQNEALRKLRKDFTKAQQQGLIEADKQAGGRLNAEAAARQRQQDAQAKQNETLRQRWKEYSRANQQGMVEADKRAGGRLNAMDAAQQRQAAAQQQQNEALRKLYNDLNKASQQRQMEADKQAGGRLNALAAAQQQRIAAQNQQAEALRNLWKDYTRGQQQRQIEADKQAGGRLNDLAAAQDQRAKTRQIQNETLRNLWKQNNRAQQQRMVEADKAAGQQRVDWSRTAQAQQQATANYLSKIKNLRDAAGQVYQDKAVNKQVQLRPGGTGSTQEMQALLKSMGMQSEGDIWTNIMEGRDLFNRTSAEAFRAANNYERSLIDTGYYDGGDDIYRMSDEGLDSYIKRLEHKAEELEIAGADHPGALWSEVFDFVNDLDMKKLESQAEGTGPSEFSWDAYETNNEAADALDRMRETEEARRQEILEEAAGFFKNANLVAELKGLEGSMARAALYDRIMGESYMERTAAMTAQEREKLDAMIDNIIEQAQGYMPNGDELDYVNGKLAEALEEQKLRGSQSNLAGWASESGMSGEYDPTLHPEAKWVFRGDGDADLVAQGTAIQQAYYWANNKQPMGLGETHKEYWMDEEMLKTFNQLYAQDMAVGHRDANGNMVPGSNRAEMYLKALDPYLTKVQMAYTENFARETAEVPVVGGLARGITYLTAPVAGAVASLGALSAMFGGSGNNADSGWYLQENFNKFVREQQNKSIDDWAVEVFGEGARGAGQFVMGVIDSMADNLIAKGVGTGLASGAQSVEEAQKIAMFSIQLIMSGEATGNAMLEQLGKGRSGAEAAEYAIMDGIVEAITEKWSLERILNPELKNMSRSEIAKHILKSFAAEGSEEIASDIANTAVDEVLSMIYDHQDELTGRYNELMEQEKLSPEEASNRAIMEKVEQMLQSGLAGGLSGGLFALGSLGTNLVNLNREGKQINGYNVGDMSGQDAVLDMAQNMPKGSAAQQQAEQILAMKGAGKNVQNWRVGELARSTEEEAAKSGDMDTLYKMAHVRGNELTKPMKDKVGQHLANEDDIRLAEGERSGGRTDAVIQGGNGARIGKVLGMNDNGKFIVEIGGQQELKDASDLKATDFGTAAIIHSRATMQGIYSDQFTDQLIRAQAEGKIQNIGKTLPQAEKIRWAAYLGRSMPQTELDSQLAEDIYRESMKEAGEQRKSAVDQVKNFRGIKNGRTVFQGTEYGTKQFEEKLESAGLSKNEQKQVRAVAEFAKLSGIELHLTTTAEAEAAGKIASAWGYHGSETAAGIELNIDSLQSEGGEKHNIAVTFGHEMTHWLMRNATQSYYQLQDFVLSTLENERGAGYLSKRAQGLMDSYATQGVELSMNEAIDEIVANSCDQVLGSEQVASYLQENQPTLFKQVQGFVKNLVDRIRKGFGNMRDSASVDAILMGQHANDLARIWLGAYDEALTGEIGKKIEQVTENGKYLLADETTREYLQGRVKKHVQMNEQATQLIYDRYGINENDIMFGIEFNDDGTVNYDAHDAEEQKLIRKISKADLKELYSISKDTQNWKKLWSDKPVEVEDYFTLGTDILKKAGLTREDMVFAFNPEWINKDGTINDTALEDAEGAGIGERTLDAYKSTIEKLKKLSNEDRKLLKGMDYWKMTGGNNQVTRDAMNRFIVPGHLAEKYGIKTVRYGKYTGLNRDAYTMSNISELDKAYADAVKSGDMETATAMLMEKLKNSENIIPFNAPHGFGGQHKDIAKLIKNGTPEAVAKAAGDMASYVPDNAVLVPMPNHHGEVNNDTDTMILAKAIGELTGRPVVTALAGADRESRYAAKAEGKAGATAEELGFYQAQDLPEGTIPIFIDNVVGSGVTAQAAEKALGGGITLAYAKSTLSKGIEGLKKAAVTYDSKGNLIPLSQRFDISKRDYRYSVAEHTKNAAEEVKRIINDQWTDNEAKSYEEIEDLIGDEYKALSQWMHNTYQKGENRTKAKPITKQDVLQFIEKDIQTLEKNYDQITDGWKQLIRSDFKPSGIDVTNEEARNTKLRSSTQYLKQTVLNGKTDISVTNTNTSADVRVDEETFAKSLIYNKRNGLEYGETEKILKKTKELLKGAVYVGSHDNYAHPGYMVHYLANIIKDGENKVTVFAVHDAFDQNQSKLFNEKAYLAEIMIEEKEDVYGLLSLLSDNGQSEAQYKYRIASSNQSIISIINAVNPTRIRYFDKSKLAGKTVRFSLTAPVEQTKDLIAVHNLGAEQLMKVLKLGGFAMPSIAVIRDNYAHNRYGDISVVFNKETIDPRASKRNKVYGGDAWTPTYPSVEHKISSKKLGGVIKRINKLVPDNVRTSNVDLYEENLERMVNSNRGDIVSAVKNNLNLQMAYLADKGIKIDYPMREESLARGSKFTNSEVLKIVETLGEDVIREGYEYGSEWFDQHPEVEETVINVLNELKQQKLMDRVKDAEKAAKMLDMLKYSKDNFGYGKMNTILGAAYQYLNRGIKQELDEYALRDVLKEKIDQTDYEEWLKNELSGVVEKSGIRNNKDFFTDMGNRRSWEALHDEETLENVVKVMQAEEDKGSNTFFNQSEILALGTRNLKSIDDIRKHKDQLKHISDEEMSAAKTDIVDRFGVLADALSKNKDGGLYEQLRARDNVRSAIVGAIRKSRNVQGIVNEMREWGYNVSREQAQEILDLMEEIANLPTEYFEAKPKRAVGLDEIAKVILPADTDKALLDQLDELGIPYETYDGTDEDRLAKLNGQESAKFSMAENNMDVGHWLEGLAPSSLRTEGERQLQQAYKSLRMSIKLSEKRQAEYSAEIQKLQGRDNLLPDERDQLIALQNKLQIQQDKHARLEDELAEVTSSEGYAGMMYYHTKMLQDFVAGRTQEQVQASVDQMVQAARTAKADLEKQEKNLQKMAESAEIRTAKSLMRKQGLQGYAKDIKSQMNTTMSQTEIENRLAEIALRQLKGEAVKEDIAALAEDIMTSQAGYGNEEAAEILSRIRGRTFVISPGQQAELKATHITLKDLREKVKGSGIKFEYGNTSTLSGQELEELFDLLPELRASQYAEEMKKETSAVAPFADFIQDQLQQRRGSTAEEGTLERDMVELTLQSISNMILNGEKNNPELAREMLQTIVNKRGEAEQALATIRSLKQRMDDTVTAGIKANMWTQALGRDMDNTIDYFNKTARWAAEVERQRVRKNVIEMLKSENARKLIEQEEKFKELIKKDKRARELHEDNESLRKQIHTVIGRVKNLLTAETDQKNIQEEAKPLARFMAGLLVNHDSAGFRHVMYASKKELADFAVRLDRLNAQEEKFDPERDLAWAVIKAPNEEENDYTVRDKLVQDLIDIETGLMEYRNAEGKGNISLQDRNKALEKVQEAVSEIYSVIKARSEAHIARQKYNVFELAESFYEDAQKSTFKGERRGFGSKAADSFWKSVGYGNLTPEYFIKNLKNRTMTLLQKGMHDAEQRSGLEARKAQAKIEQIAKETGYSTWDGQEKHKIRLVNGSTVEMTTEQIMALYATWQRESNQLRPEETSHLLKGGFVLAANEQNKGKYRREQDDLTPIRVHKGDLEKLSDYLTPEQIQFVDAIVDYMSNDMAALGNEASLKTYGIRKFTEKYYYPIKAWGGVLNKSSASGTSNMNDNRAMRQSFTKRIQNKARNAIEISDFTPTAMKHIVGMINFNTVGPAVENMNKVLNQQLQFGEVNRNGAELPEDGEYEDETYKRNMRAVFQQKYGKNAYKYLEQFMDDVNGGVSRRDETSLKGKLLSIFKKNAVAGSLSVAAQQPLSYIRAAMLVNPKYLAQAISPQYWKGSYNEMMEHSGLAVIKDMGQFDMNYGQSMQDYITPEGMKSKAKQLAEKTGEAVTSLPGMMDAMTWTRMWTACKLEQHALNPDMDMKSDEFLDKVTERFNEVMRRTQVYDSVMVKSQNMRSKSDWKKAITSFMAEPTLSLNVLADAWQNVKEKGGKANAVKALAAFLLSAAAQAGVKGFFGAARSPKKEKNKEENFMNRFAMAMMSETNPLGLIPGYSQLAEVMINGELNDDAMGMISKAKDAWDKIYALATGKEGDRGLYRELEDSLGQLVQIGTDIPLKNFMRDFRAMVNWFSGGAAQGLTGDTYAQRETSAAVLKYQTRESLFTKEIGGLINAMMGEAGYKTTNDAYYKRLYRAVKDGRTKEADQLQEFMTLTKIKAEDPEKTIRNQLNKMAREDDNLPTEEKAKIMKEIDPEADDDSIFFQLDREAYEKETGTELSGSSKYYRLDDAMKGNKSAEIREAVQTLLEHGVKAKSIIDRMKDQKQAYLEADSKGKVRIRNAIQIVYKELGYTAEDADKVIDKWKN